MSQKMEGNDLFASMIAMHVRNAIEDMHADRAIGLTDDVMAELNKLTRRAIWEVLEMRLDDRQPTPREVVGVH